MFCQNCGAQLTGDFCTKCGTPAGQPSASAAAPSATAPSPSAYAAPASAAAPPPQSAAPLAAATKSGSGLKIVLVLLGIFGFLGVLAIGGVWYGVHFAAQKVQQAAANNGIDLNSFSQTRSGPALQYDACQLLTKEDLSQILSLPVERAESDGKSTHSNCRYYSSGAQQRSLDEAAAAKKKIEEESKDANSKPDPASVIADFGNLVRGATGAAAPALGGTDGLVLTVGIDSENGKAAMAGFKLGMGLTGAAVLKDANADPRVKNMMREDVPGVGDEAISGPLLSLFMFRKGDVSVQLDARLLPGGRDAQIAIAKRILSKL